MTAKSFFTGGKDFGYHEESKTTDDAGWFSTFCIHCSHQWVSKGYESTFKCPKCGGEQV